MTPLLLKNVLVHFVTDEVKKKTTHAFLSAISPERF